MDMICEERLSDSPYIERVWHSYSEQATTFISMAESHWGMAVTKHNGSITLTIRGPEIRATPAYGLADAEFIGIQFRHGTLMPDFPAKLTMDRQDINLPQASSQSFWLKGASWQFPDYDNVETFVARLVQDGLLIRDPVVGAVLQGHSPEMSLRTIQRRFLGATGLTQGAVCQIDRARYATILLKQGVSILDTVEQAGYSDQPHLTRALKHYVGQTPAQLAANNNRESLSFLFKTQPF